MKVLVKAAPLESNSVNVLGWVNVLENMFNSINAINFVNMSVGGMYSSIFVPLDAFKSPNVSLWYIDNVITDAGAHEKAFDETVDNVLP